MSFQSTVRLVQTTGIIGEIIFDGPHRARPLNLNSGGATPNTVGKAFTFDDSVDDEAGAGAIGAGAFAGILINPKHYALYGSSLTPSLDLPDNTNAEVLSMGTIIVDLSAVDTGKIGEGIYYVDATGVLGSGTAAAGQTQIVGAKIDRENISGAGLAIITLTEPTQVPFE
ncbi:MAG: hypothetical protein GY751_10790 [Bacteroidetes bacterium]|nr:hypothetical protein [Bacteroidota bacterium]